MNKVSETSTYCFIQMTTVGIIIQTEDLLVMDKNDITFLLPLITNGLMSLVQTVNLVFHINNRCLQQKKNDARDKYRFLATLYKTPSQKLTSPKNTK